MQDIDSVPVGSGAAPAVPETRSRVLEIRFTGSGSEYFRIWAVNLLLILVTLGLYFPFAKARRIRYFYANTLVDGQALSFHGDAWKMFRGFLLLIVLMGAYSAAGHLSPVAAIVAFLILCAVWPALWRASLQFRLGNTSWRGLRMRFDGSLKAAYLACAPSYLPAIALVGGASLMDPEAMKAGGGFTPAVGVYMVGAACMMLLAPWSLALFKRYQHNGYRIAGQQSRVKLSVAEMYLLSLKVIGVSLPPMLLMGLIVAAFTALSTALDGPRELRLAFVGLGVVLGYVVYFAIVMPYGAARLQNLVWNGTRSEVLAFRSQLKFRSLCRLTLKNWLLTLVTLGLYRPFAAVSAARLRLQSVHIDSSSDPEHWVATASAGHEDATGEAAGDFFGIDMGL
ncbi:YjgN family protein [Roseateles sp. DC23W]|uniref:YjgN family protein n=1 Tax=Pelomonas dachongensis TaxID=3299029 RepID=A0ABW7ELA6_9BURK